MWYNLIMEISLIIILTIVASAIGTVTGFGTSTIMIPALALFLPPVEAIFLVSIIHWFGNVWKVTLFRSGLNWRLVGLFGLTGLLTSYLGASVTLNVDNAVLLRGLGIFFAAYAVFLLLQSKLKVPASLGMALLGGSLSGFFAGMFGIGGAIRSAFLTIFDLPKSVYIATAGAIGLMVDLTRVVTYIAGGISLSPALSYGLIIFIPVSLLGAYVGKLVVNKISQQQFRAVIAVLIFVIGIKLIIWP